MRNRYMAGRVLIPLSLLLLLIFTFPGLIRATDNDAKIKPAPAVNPLPVVGSKEKLLDLLKEAGGYNLVGGGMTDNAVKEAAPQSQSDVALRSVGEGTAGNAKSSDYSATNIQVQGVDESDIVKNDGEYIYQVNQSQILIIKAAPADKMQVVSRLKLNEPNFTPRELYVDQKHLVVIGDCWREQAIPYSSSGAPAKAKIMPYYRNYQGTLMVEYDITDKSQIKQVRELAIEGSVLSSRKIGSYLYLAVNDPVMYYANDAEPTPPSYRDSATGAQEQALDYNRIRYFPDHLYPSFIVLAGIDLDQPGQKADVQSYLGNGENLYASSENLYLAMGEYPQIRPMVSESTASKAVAPATPSTTLYKFRLQAGTTVYSSKGTVPGTIINQFSMDEYQGYFRIATTTGDTWRSDDNTSRNNVYVLDQNLNLTGKLEGLAPGEKIYSTRFLGDRAYMVTFKQVDPLFVISLKDPAKPEILGKLKIPGYSNYLHPYDENHIIGFGKDAVEVKDAGGSSMAFYQGLKIALFDVSDVNHPREISKQVIGDRGTDSELLSNHKALLFSRDKSLLAFPVTVMQISGNDSAASSQGIPAYGSFSFQGLYVYNIDLKDGLKFKGRISHLSDQDYLKAGDNWYDSSKNIDRALYIGNTLYTLSISQIQAHGLSDLKALGSLVLNPAD